MFVQVLGLNELGLQCKAQGDVFGLVRLKFTVVGDIGQIGICCGGC